MLISTFPDLFLLCFFLGSRTSDSQSAQGSEDTRSELPPRPTDVSHSVGKSSNTPIEVDKPFEKTVPASTPEPLSQTTLTNISLLLDKGKRTLPVDMLGRPEVEDVEILHQHRESRNFVWPH